MHMWCCQCVYVSMILSVYVVICPCAAIARALRCSVPSFRSALTSDNYFMGSHDRILVLYFEAVNGVDFCKSSITWCKARTCHCHKFPLSVGRNFSRLTMITADTENRHNKHHAVMIARQRLRVTECRRGWWQRDKVWSLHQQNGNLYSRFLDFLTF